MQNQSTILFHIFLVSSYNFLKLPVIVSFILKIKYFSDVTEGIATYISGAPGAVIAGISKPAMSPAASAVFLKI